MELKRQQAAYHFKATNAEGFSVDIDDATAYDGGTGHGVGPMQLLVMAIGGCSGVDIVAILEKSRQPVESFDIRVHGHKPDGTSPSLYDRIHLEYVFTGNMDESKVRRAIDLSLGKYCSVAKTLEKTAEISYSFELNGRKLEGSPLQNPD